MYLALALFWMPKEPFPSVASKISVRFQRCPVLEVLPVAVLIDVPSEVEVTVMYLPV